MRGGKYTEVRDRGQIHLKGLRIQAQGSEPYLWYLCKKRTISWAWVCTVVLCSASLPRVSGRHWHTDPEEAKAGTKSPQPELPTPPRSTAHVSYLDVRSQLHARLGGQGGETAGSRTKAPPGEEVRNRDPRSTFPLAHLHARQEGEGRAQDEQDWEQVPIPFVHEGPKKRKALGVFGLALLGEGLPCGNL